MAAGRTEFAPKLEQKTSTPEEQQRIQDQADDGELFEGIVRIQLRHVRPVAAEIIVSPELRMVVRRAERHSKRQGHERHQDRPIADLVAGQDRPLLFERDAAQEKFRHGERNIVIGRE